VDLLDVVYMGCELSSLSTVWSLMACCHEHGTELSVFSVLKIIHPVSFSCKIQVLSNRLIMSFFSLTQKLAKVSKRRGIKDQDDRMCPKQ